MCCFYAK